MSLNGEEGTVKILNAGVPMNDDALVEKLGNTPVKTMWSGGYPNKEYLTDESCEQIIALIKKDIEDAVVGVVSAEKRDPNAGGRYNFAHIGSLNHGLYLAEKAIRGYFNG